MSFVPSSSKSIVTASLPSPSLPFATGRSFGENKELWTCKTLARQHTKQRKSTTDGTCAKAVTVNKRVYRQVGKSVPLPDLESTTHVACAETVTVKRARASVPYCEVLCVVRTANIAVVVAGPPISISTLGSERMGSNFNFFAAALMAQITAASGTASSPSCSFTSWSYLGTNRPRPKKKRRKQHQQHQQQQQQHHQPKMKNEKKSLRHHI